MRSLSLESIPVNKNMKVLILLVALLVQTNPSLSKPIHLTLFTEILGNLRDMKEELQQHDLKAFSETVKIQIPHDLKNACECEAPFLKHLKDNLKLVEEKLDLDEIANILDSLNKRHLPKVKKPNDNCNFTTRNLREALVQKYLIVDNIHFIENWNANCKSKTKHH